MSDFKELPGEVGHAPLSRAGVLIERPDRIPVMRRNLIAGQLLDFAAKFLRLPAFLTDGLALAETQVRQKIVKAPIGPIFPMVLLAGPRHHADLRACLGL